MNILDERINEIGWADIPSEVADSVHDFIYFGYGDCTFREVLEKIRTGDAAFMEQFRRAILYGLEPLLED